jgi:hypothetical protein
MSLPENSPRADMPKWRRALVYLFAGAALLGVGYFASIFDGHPAVRWAGTLAIAAGIGCIGVYRSSGVSLEMWQARNSLSDAAERRMGRYKRQGIVAGAIMALSVGAPWATRLFDLTYLAGVHNIVVGSAAAVTMLTLLWALRMRLSALALFGTKTD